MNMDTAASALTDDFLLTFVHDMRAYIRKSLAGVQLLERSIGETLDTAAKQRIQQVIAANRDMEAFLARLSDYANAAQLRQNRRLPLSTVVQAATLQFAPLVFEIEQAPANTGAEMQVPQEMVRIFTELIDNALKFSKNGRVRIRIEAPQVTVEDSGIGILPGQEENVFGLLTRLQSKDDYPGFGMGLPICRRVADLVGAEVRLAPNPAGGTIATVNVHTYKV